MVFTGDEGTDKVKIGVVPFAASVNVGPANINAAWMDANGLAPTHFENFAEPKTRFDLLKQMGVAWAGCVEVRPAPHDVTDSTPTDKTPATLFVPMFNPDEPDDANSDGNSYGNNYLPDYGGSCPAPPPTCLKLQQEGQLLVVVAAAGAHARRGPGAGVQIPGRLDRLGPGPQLPVRQRADPAADQGQERRRSP